MAVEIFITDKRVLQLMEFVISNHIKGITTQRDFLKIAGMHPTVLAKIRKGIQGFTVKHIRIFSEYFDANLNWIFGFEPNMMNNNKSKINHNPKPLEMMKEALFALELEMKQKPQQESNTAKNKQLVKKVSNSQDKN